MSALPVLGQDGTVYAGIQNTLCALDPLLQTQRWAFATGQPISGPAAVAADGTVYFGSQDGRFYALDGAVGTLRWVLQTDGPIRSSPNIGSDGTVYVGSDDGKIDAFVGSAPLAASAWPNFRCGAENRGSLQQTGGPVIVSPMPDRVGAQGRAVALSVSADGLWPFDYQLFFCGKPLSQATSAVYNIASFAATNVGDYHVVVGNAAGSNTGITFHVDIGYAIAVDTYGPGIVQRQPDQDAYLPGTQVTLSALPTGYPAEHVRGFYEPRGGPGWDRLCEGFRHQSCQSLFPCGFRRRHGDSEVEISAG